MKWLVKWLVILSVIAIGKATSIHPWFTISSDPDYKIHTMEKIFLNNTSEDPISKEAEHPHFTERHQQSFDFWFLSIQESIYQNLLALNTTYSRMREIVSKSWIADEYKYDDSYLTYIGMRYILPNLDVSYLITMEDLLHLITSLRANVKNSLCSCRSTTQAPHTVNDEEHVTSAASTTEEVINEFPPDFVVDKIKEKEDHVKEREEEHEKEHEKDSVEESVKEENKELPKPSVNPVPNYADSSFYSDEEDTSDDTQFPFSHFVESALGDVKNV